MAADEPAPRRSWPRIAALGMLAGLLLGLLGGAVVIGPYLRDDLALDRIVRVVALDWRDFGEEKARARLEFELDDQGIGLHVRDEDCSLDTLEDGVRRVVCRWSIALSIPGSQEAIPVSFTSEVRISAAGDLVP